MTFRLIEQVAYTAGTDTHEHLHKFRTGNGEEWYARFARDCFRKQGLAGSGRAVHQGQALGGHGGRRVLGNLTVELAQVGGELIDDLEQRLQRGRSRFGAVTYATSCPST